MAGCTSTPWKKRSTPTRDRIVRDGQAPREATCGRERPVEEGSEHHRREIPNPARPAHANPSAQHKG